MLYKIIKLDPKLNVKLCIFNYKKYIFIKNEKNFSYLYIPENVLVLKKQNFLFIKSNYKLSNLRKKNINPFLIKLINFVKNINNSKTNFGKSDIFYLICNKTITFPMQ